MPTRAAWPKNSKLSAKTKRKKMLQLSLKENRNKTITYYKNQRPRNGDYLELRGLKKSKLPAAGIN